MRCCIFIAILLGALAELQKCRSDINDMPSKYPGGQKMIYYSGRGFDDLGLYNECNNLTTARYALLEAKLNNFRISLGFCGPINCTLDDYSFVGREIYEQLNLSNYDQLKDYKAHFPDEFNSEGMKGSAIFVLILWILLIVTVISGTIFDLMAQKNPHKRFGPISQTTMAFSIIANWNKLATLPTEFDTLQIFNGLRVFCMVMVVFGHSYIYQLSGAFSNPARLIDLWMDFQHLFMILYVVDVFFLMAGFLLAFLTTAHLKASKGRMNWGVFELHRFIRLIPIYYMVFFTYAFLLRYIGSGPQWPLVVEVTPKACQDYWWSNLLFINNMVPSDEFSCMGWGWYIANDVQFYVFSPIILILYYRKKLWGYLACWGLIGVNWLIVGIEANVNDWNPTLLSGLGNKDQFLGNYVKPYARMSPYLLGMIAGFMYRASVDAKAQKTAVKQTTVELNPHYNLIQEEPPVERDIVTYFELKLLKWVHVPAFRYIGYIFGFSLMVIINFSPYQLNHHGLDYWSTAHKAAFMTFDHFGFCFGLLFFIIPMLFGYCRCLLYVLTLRILSPLAKVSFAFYVVHPLFIYWYVFSRDQALYYDDLDICYHAVGTLLFASIAGTILSLMVESPILALEKKLLRGGKK